MIEEIKERLRKYLTQVPSFHAKLIVDHIESMIDEKLAQYKLTLKPFVPGIVSEAKDDGKHQPLMNDDILEVLAELSLKVDGSFGPAILHLRPDTAKQITDHLQRRGYKIVKTADRDGYGPVTLTDGRSMYRDLADLTAKHRRLIEENAKLRDALKPFSDWAKREYIGTLPIDSPVVYGGPTMRNLYDAVEALGGSRIVIETYP
jgi:hypothetical protein